MQTQAMTNHEKVNQPTSTETYVLQCNGCDFEVTKPVSFPMAKLLCHLHIANNPSHPMLFIPTSRGKNVGTSYAHSNSNANANSNDNEDADETTEF